MKYLSPILRWSAVTGVVFALMLSLCVTPAAAQDAQPTAREKELREWYNGLGKNRQDELKRRFKAFKQLPRERQQQIMKLAKEGKPILTDQQRENLKKLKKLSYLERVRLYTTAAELSALRRMRSAEFEAAIKLDAPERQAKLHELLKEQRRNMFMRTLPDEQRRRIMRTPLDERDDAIDRLYRQEAKERIEKLAEYYPRLAELREAAERGDKEARHELRSLFADLRTLDQLMQRLTPERREEVTAELKDLSMDQAADKVRKALQDQWQRERKQPRDRRDKPDRAIPDRNNRRGRD